MSKISLKTSLANCIWFVSQEFNLSAIKHTPGFGTLTNLILVLSASSSSSSSTATNEGKREARATGDEREAQGATGRKNKRRLPFLLCGSIFQEFFGKCSKDQLLSLGKIEEETGLPSNRIPLQRKGMASTFWTRAIAGAASDWITFTT